MRKVVFGIGGHQVQVGQETVCFRHEEKFHNPAVLGVTVSYKLDAEAMKKRVTDVVERFGEERILYAGPECGLKGYPTYNNALECLKRISAAVCSLKK